ncbi:PAS domain-containing sensor histidine kinase [Halorubrum gandharaense]
MPDSGEGALWAEPELVQGILETSPVGITIVDADGEVVFANEHAEEIYGRTQEALNAFAHDDPRWDLVDEEGEPLGPEEAPFDRVLAEEEPVYDQVVGLRWPSGERVWVSVNGAPQWDEHGDLKQVVFAFEDITEQRELETELEEVFGRVTDAFFALDEEYRFTHVNDRAEELLQASEAELIGETIWTQYPEAAETEDVWEAFQTAMQTQDPRSFDLYYEPLDFWVEATVYPSKTGVSVYFRDVTERVDRQEQLRSRERALHEAYEIIADPDRPFDEKVEALLEQVRSTIGTDYATLSWADERTNEYVFEAIAGPADADLEAGDSVPLDATNCERVVRTRRTLVLADVENDAPELADRAGNAEWGISCYLGTPVTVDDEVYGTFCFYDMSARTEAFSDWEVTFVELLGQWLSYELERDQYQQELEASNERLEQFAYAVSHDLQEPLRMVSSYLSLLEQRYSDALDDDAEEFIDFAVDGAERMKEMIEGLLEYSRVEQQGDPLSPTDLDTVLEDVLDDLRMQIDATDAEVAVDPLPVVEGDASQLRQVFQNLLDNAITYSGEEPPRIEVTAEQQGDEVVVSVRDEGIGIDPEHQDRIFEVFNRLHTQEEYSGTGIGLALCQRIVERHGGDIWIESEPGEGTTFSFTLPAAVSHD